MSKAKGKPKTPTTGTNPPAGAWEASLASTVISDEELRVVIHLLSPEKVEDKLQFQILGNAVDTNVRHKFAYINQATLIAQGKDYGKTKDSGSKASFPEAFAMLKANDEAVPASVIAKILKVKVLELRDNELAAREEASKGKNGHVSRSPVKSVSPDKGKKDNKAKGGKKSPTKKGSEGSNILPEDEISRGKCPLKKRGEEKEEPKTIVDYPEGGPDIYVICTGFDQPDIFNECQKTLLPIMSHISVASAAYSKDVAFFEHLAALTGKSRRVQVVVSEEEEISEIESRVQEQQDAIEAYNKDITYLITENPLPTCFVDIAFDKMVLPQLVIDNDIKKDAEKVEELQLGVFQHVADKLYDMHHTYCEYLQYKKGMELVNVADLTATNEEGVLLHPLDMRCYDKLMSAVPYESVTTATVLDAILGQVCQEAEETPKETECPIKKQLGSLIQSLPLSLAQQTDFEDYISLKREKSAKAGSEQPTVLKAGDEIGQKTFHLSPELATRTNERKILELSLCNKMLELPQASPEVLAKIQSMAHEVDMFCADVSQGQLNGALRQFAFEGANLSEAKPGISPLKESKDYFWDVELLIDTKSEVSSEMNKLKAVNVPKSLRNLDHYNYSTCYEKDALLQVLSEAYYTYPYCERLYHRQEHSMLLLFHAGYNDQRKNITGWRNRAHSSIGFHHFMSRTKQEFAALLATMPPLTPAPVPSEVTAPPTPVTPAIVEDEVEPEFVMPVDRLEGLKKRSELQEEKQERVPTGKKGAKDAKTKSPTKRKGSPSPKRKGSPAKSPKRSGPPSRQSSAKSTTQVEFEPVILMPEAEMDIIMEGEPGRNMFVGFNLPNRILEASGTMGHCHPSDGGLVRVEKCSFDGERSRNRITVLKDGHTLAINRLLKSEMDLRREKRATADKKRAEQEAVEAATEKTAVSVEEEEEVVVPEEEAPLSDIPNAINTTFNARLRSGLCLSFEKRAGAPTLSTSLPTGLIIEYLPADPEHDFYSVRQHYEKKTLLKQACEQTQLKRASEETSRLVLSNGSVIKHLSNGYTYILYPDGGYAIKHPAPVEVPLPPPEMPVAETPVADSTCTAGTPVATPAPRPPPPHIVWCITKENGEREQVMSDDEHQALPPLQCYSATDPETKEVMFTRVDSILSVSRPDGTRIVDHTDGTRITTIFNREGTAVEYKMECSGYATMRFTPTDCKTLFGISTTITSEANNTLFTIADEDGAVVVVDSEREVINFTPQGTLPDYPEPNVLQTVREDGVIPFSKIGQYELALTKVCAFKLTDNAANVFEVDYEGKISSEKPDAHVIQHLNNYYQNNELDYDVIEGQCKPPMRMFIIHPNNTGTELMSLRHIEHLFSEADNNPEIVKVEEEVEGATASKGITFLKPFYGSSESKWGKEFDEGNIVPNGLVYDGSIKPAEQIVGGWEKREQTPDMVEPVLPPAIHYYQVIENPAITPVERENMLNGLRAHATWMVEQELHSQKASIPDLRSEAEKEASKNMLTRVSRQRSNGQSLEAEGGMDGLPAKSAIVSPVPSSSSPSSTLNSLRGGGLTTSDDDYSDDEDYVGEMMTPMEKKQNTIDNVTRKYSTAVSSNPFKNKMTLPIAGIITQARWDRIFQEKLEMNVLKSDLRHFRVPPYFESKFGETFLASLQEGPNMGALSDQVPSPDTRSPVCEKSSNNVESLSTSMIFDEAKLDVSSSTSLQSTSRPHGPTPNVGIEHSPTQDSDRKLTTHSEEIATPEHDVPSSAASKVGSGQVKSLYVDVKGDARPSKVKIPRSIQGYKPSTEPNVKFLESEEPVRRGVRTSSVLAASSRKKVSEMRGFQILPPEVTYGVLCPGGTYASTVTLKNVGIDSCRFQIKCPRNDYGVAVALHCETNFVAAGMSVKFDVRICAPEVTEILHISLNVDVVMEMEIFHLPVVATILPYGEYNERSKSGKLNRLPQHIKIIDVTTVINSSSTVYRDVKGRMKLST